jgi:nucleoside-diphosphate-sugar epimerase
MAISLVTGGAGFIGSHLVGTLVARGHAVRVLDNLSTGSLANLQAVAGEVELITGDVTDPAVAREAARGAELVFHHAAQESVPRGVHDPLATHHSCATGTLQLLLAARDGGARRFVYASSSSVYGDAGGLPRREGDPPRPVSAYAAAKLAGEHYCEIFTRVYGLETVRLRYFSVYGPRQADAAAVPRFVQAMLAGGSPEVHGDGRQSRDFTYVDDVVQATLLAAGAARVAGKVYNIAYGGRTNLLELVGCLNDLLGTRIKPVHAAPRPGDVRHSVADTSLAQAELGYCPCTPLQDGLARCLAYGRGPARPATHPAGPNEPARGPHQRRLSEGGAQVSLSE